MSAQIDMKYMNNVHSSDGEASDEEELDHAMTMDQVQHGLRREMQKKQFR